MPHPHIDRTIQPKPLDYVYLTSIDIGLKSVFASKPDAIPSINKRNGMAWWFGKPPIESYPYTIKSLRELFLDYVSSHIDHDFVKDRKQSNITNPYRDLAFEWYKSFAHFLSDRGQIDCTFVNNNTELEMNINTCPFCFNKSVTCLVFLGIAEATIDWLLGYTLPTNMPKAPQIISLVPESTGHKIRLALKT